MNKRLIGFKNMIIPEKLEKDLEKKLQKLSPEARKRLDGLLG